MRCRRDHSRREPAGGPRRRSPRRPAARARGRGAHVHGEALGCEQPGNMLAVALVGTGDQSCAFVHGSHTSRSQAPGQGQSVPGSGGQEAVWRGRSWPTTCGTAGRPCVRTRSACRRRAPPAAHRACAAKRWRSSPTCRSTTTRGWSRPGDRGRRPGSWTRWPARCGSRGRAQPPVPPGGFERTARHHRRATVRPHVVRMLDRLPETGAVVTDAAYHVVAWNPWPRHCSAATSETGRRTWPAAASSAGADVRELRQ